MIENVDYVICPICFKKMEQLSYHLNKIHNLTKEEFNKKFPNQKLVCQNNIDKAKIITKGRNSLQYFINKFGLKEGTERFNKYSIKRRNVAIGNKNGMFGKTHSNETKNNIRNKKLGKKMSEECKQNMKISAKTRIHHKHSEETKRKQRIKAIERILLNNGYFPNYNKEACEIFKKFDEINKTQGFYAKHGNGEFHIPFLGRWLDYMNFDLKLIIEVDEKYHEKQKEKDNIRQKMIEELYPEFKFLRFKEEEMNKILELKIDKKIKQKITFEKFIKQ